MKIRRGNRLGFSETSASSDVAFLLIIYFLVIAGFNVNFGFLLNLPAKGATRVVLKNDLLRFDLDARGELSSNGRALTLAQAESGIRSAVGSRPGLAVLLSIDPAAPWQSVVSFVALAQKLNVESFSFKMKERQGDG
jgi:biopolymer transport protein ExbD